MHYKIGPTITIKTENAAKPDKQSSAYLKSLISDLEPVGCSFDYGCGKLRYKDAILQTTDTLALIDFEVQLSRKQMVCGTLTTIRAAIRRSNRVSAFNVSEFSCLAQTFERGFCINVLSVIPYFSARRHVLNLIRSKLRPSGTCLFVVQYRNSDFTRMQAMSNARPWRDGFLINSLRGFSFYALISPERLEAMVLRAGFEVIEQKLNEGSVYLLVRSPVMPSPALSMDISEINDFRVSLR